MPLFIILALAIALFAVLFALQNTAPVTIAFFGLQFRDPLALILLITLVLGVIVGLLLAVPSVIRRSLIIGSQKRKLQELEYELHQREQAIATERGVVTTVQQNSQELLRALTMTDASTGLLKGEGMLPAVGYLLERRAANPELARDGAVCVYVLEVSPAESMPLDQGLQVPLYQAIATRLQQDSVPSSWLFHDGVGRFGCVVVGLTARDASDLGETLRASFANTPLELEGGLVMAVTVAIGGAIAPSANFDCYTLLQQAEVALDQAKKRGRNRFKLVEATA
ncbi:lipopolysaccharide assembly protein LapA domain-containing protein [Leptolyngbya sp. AN02str]|uniref:lipopolysaccharide assembly protein LapA domain-containing protein n=1 Tax=Leptolyngbya sp. AN02str TaxID=3423363 RepID=UPI003D31BAD6